MHTPTEDKISLDREFRCALGYDFHHREFFSALCMLRMSDPSFLSASASSESLLPKSLETEQRLRLILDSLLSFVGIMTPDGILIEANRTALEAASLQPEDVLGKPFDQTYWWAYDSDIQAQLRQAIERAAQGEMVRYDVQVRLASDRFLIIDFSLVPIFNEVGQVTHLIPSGIDISDRKQAEQSLRRSEAIVRAQLTEIESIYQSAPIGLGVLDRDLRFQRINQELADINGLSVPEHLGRSIREVLPKLADEAEPLLRQVLDSGKPLLNLEIAGETPAQPGIHRIWLENWYPLQDAQGQVTGISIVCQEITERKRAEDQLRQSEERYRYLTESIPQLVWTASAEGDLLDVNQRWLDYTGLGAEQARTAGWHNIVHPEDLPALEANWAMAQTTGQRYQAEGRLRRVTQGQAEYRWHLHQAVPLKDEAGQVLKWFGTATDIEDQKQIEAQRSRLLRHEQTAREEAERANRIKDEFLAVLSHELRTPLNPIIGWTQLLRSGRLPVEKTEQALATIERNARLQVQLIDDLLDVSRILRGKLELKVERVDLATTIRAANETVRLAAEAKAIQVRLELSSGVNPVMGDEGRLQQVVWNLLSNAVKFTPAEGQVTVSLIQINHQAQLQVCDTGKGITPGFLPYVFDYFRQADSATTRQFGGLGLGLAIVRQIVELHGGTVQAESPGEGCGTTFTVLLPMARPKPSRVDQGSLSAGVLSAVPTTLTGYRLLIVDDEPDALIFVTFVLEAVGAEVVAVSSAAAALQALENGNFDGMVSDIGMPDMDGYGLLRQIRALPEAQGGGIRAIALTAYAGELNGQQAKAAGFQYHLSKPVDAELLVQQVFQLLNQP